MAKKIKAVPTAQEQELALLERQRKRLEKKIADENRQIAYLQEMRQMLVDLDSPDPDVTHRLYDAIQEAITQRDEAEDEEEDEEDEDE